MKKIILSLILVLSILGLAAQVYTSGTTANEFAVSSAINEGTEATGTSAFAAGYYTKAQGNYSTSLGAMTLAKGNGSFAVGQLAEVLSGYGIAMGRFVRARQNTSFVMGYGNNIEDMLENNTANSFMMGFKSNVPTLYVGPASGGSTLGNVGIGTTSPSTLLDVAGTLNVEGNAGFGNDIYADGDIGVGTTAPTTKLHVVGDKKKDATLFLEPYGMGEYGKVAFGTGEHFIKANSISGLVFHTKTNSDFYFENGNLLIESGHRIRTDFITGMNGGVKILNNDDKEGIYVRYSGEIQLGLVEIEPKADIQIRERGSIWYRQNNTNPNIGSFQIGNNVHNGFVKKYEKWGGKYITDGWASAQKFFNDGTIMFLISAEAGIEDENVLWNYPALTISNTSNVCVGYFDNPEEAKLYVLNGEDGPALHLRCSGQNTEGLRIDHLSNADVDVVRITTDYVNPNIAKTAFYIDKDGNVGINTDDPLYQLDIVGVTQSTEIRTEQISSSTAAALDIVGDNDEGIHIASDGKVVMEDLEVEDLEVSGNFIIDNVSIDNLEVDNLDVNVLIETNEILVKNMSKWQDQVFDEDYNLASLSSVEEFIQNNHHLKNIPSEAEVLAKGYKMAEMDALLLQKIEELTLYVFQLKQEIEENKLKIEQQ